MNKLNIKINFLIVILMVFCFTMLSFGSSFRPRTVAEERARVYASKANPKIIYQPSVKAKKVEDMYSEESVSPDGIDYSKYIENKLDNIDTTKPPLELFEVWLNDSLNVSFGANNFSYVKDSNGKTYTIKTWYQGLTEKLLTYFAVANSQNPLFNIKEVTSAFSNTVYDYLRLLGINDWSIDFYVVSDFSHTDVFLNYKNGKLIFDVTNK